MRSAKHPTREQREIIRQTGLNPSEWLVVNEDRNCLYLVDDSMEQRQAVTISKSARRII